MPTAIGEFMMEERLLSETGLTEEKIDELIVRDDRSDQTWAICYDETKNDGCALPCSHVFH